MRTETNKPAKTLRDGAIKAVIWRNASEKGAYFSVQMLRSYKDGDAWKDVNAFTNGDLLKAARLLERAYDALANLKAGDAAEDMSLEAEVTL